MRKSLFSGLTSGGGNRAAMFGAMAFGVLGLAVAAGALILMSPSSSLGASESGTPAAAAALPAPIADYKFAKELAAAGVKGCAPLVEAMSGNLMQGATEFATVSNWNKDAPNGRIVSTLTGQKFGSSPAVPNGLAGVFASPQPDGKCDAVSVQVVPSPANCATLQTAIAKSGKTLGALAGVPVMSDGSGQVMLVPTGANTCIIVGIKIAYAK